MSTPIGKRLKRRNLTREEWRIFYRKFRDLGVAPRIHAEMDRLLFRHASLMLVDDMLAKRAVFRSEWYEPYGTRPAMHHMIKKTHGRPFEREVPRFIPALPLKGYFIKPRIVHLPGLGHD
ncbi:MAG TPA: hypothetical protein VF928_09345 [Usitatibacteraceae bacterium]